VSVATLILAASVTATVPVVAELLIRFAEYAFAVAAQFGWSRQRDAARAAPLVCEAEFTILPSVHIFAAIVEHAVEQAGSAGCRNRKRIGRAANVSVIAGFIQRSSCRMCSKLSKHRCLVFGSESRWVVGIGGG
jgi:hypothetical protein